MKSLVRVVALASLCIGCEDVPDLTFVDAAAGDAGVDGALDSASDSAATSDAPPMCPTAPPPPATRCCGTDNAYPCVGNCGATECMACVTAACGTGKLCCGKTNGMVQCITVDGHCP